MIGSLAALYRSNDLDDFDVDTAGMRLDMIGRDLPHLRPAPEERHPVRYEGPGGIEVTVRIEAGRIDFRYMREGEGRCVRTFLETPRDDALFERIVQEGPAPFLDMIDGLMSSPRGDVHSRFMNSLGSHTGPGLMAFEHNQRLAEMAARIVAVHNPRHRRMMSVVLRPPGAGHEGTIRDEKGKPLFARAIEKRIASLCAHASVLSRELHTFSFLPPAHDVMVESRHADPLELLRALADSGMPPMEGKVLTKAGMATN